MAQWLLTLDISNYRKMCNGEITSQDLSKDIVKKMTDLHSSVVGTFGKDSDLTIEFEDIIIMFETYIEYGENDDGQYDIIDDVLCEWGDTVIGEDYVCLINRS